MGVILLPTVLYLSKVLAKLAIGLDRKPELIAHLLREGMDSAQDETAEKVTLVEKSANVVREAFIKCLTDRSGTPGTQGKPEGRRVGIYLMANLCLKLLFKVRFSPFGITSHFQPDIHLIYTSAVRKTTKRRADVC